MQLYFRAVTDSYIPLLELPMDYYYDEKHIWPSEKLYRYLVKTHFEGDKKIRGWASAYLYSESGCLDTNPPAYGSLDIVSVGTLLSASDF